MLAIIPARSGSKGLRGKNILSFSGKPLIAHTIIAAKQSDCFSRIIVSTDGERIAETASLYGAEILWRPSELAQDNTDMIDVVDNIYRVLGADGSLLGKHFCLLQPTSPLRQSFHIAECVNQFFKGSFQSAVSVCEDSHSPFKSFRMQGNVLEPLFNINYISLNRQKLETTYRQNGAIYISSWENCITSRAIIQFPAMPYIMKMEDSVDIDTLEDFQRAESLSIFNCSKQ